MSPPNVSMRAAIASTAASIDAAKREIGRSIAAAVRSIGEWIGGALGAADQAPSGGSRMPPLGELPAPQSCQ
jgi:hypothetical protein